MIINIIIYIIGIYTTINYMIIILIIFHLLNITFIINFDFSEADPI